MNWEALSAIADLIAASGVIGSLIYLAVQIRQNTRTTRQTAAQSAEQFNTQIILATATSDSLNAAVSRGLAFPADLDYEDGQRFHMYMLQAFRNTQWVFFARKTNVLGESDWNFHRTAIAAFKASPGFDAWWPAGQQYFDAAFRAEVDSISPGTLVFFDKATSRFVAGPFPAGPTTPPEARV
jgi:hypothetical protein